MQFLSHYIWTLQKSVIMSQKYSDVQKEKVGQVRELFLKKHQGDVDKGTYDDRDFEKFRNDDLFISRFFRPWESLQEASNHIHECMKWRKEININDIKPSDFGPEYWDVGGMYFHNTDKDGHKILYVQVKKHVKDPEILPTIKRFFALHVETHVRATPDEQIVILFDLFEAGLAQLDMEFVKFIIKCFKSYYPRTLACMLVYEIPWIFNAAWRVIKTMLHAEAAKLIKFSTKSDIQEYIDKDQLWQHMGGTDTFVYKYEPEMFDICDDGDTNRKRVTFEDQSLHLQKSMSFDTIRDSEVSQASKLQTGILTHRRPVGTPHNRRVSHDDNSFRGRLLTICPAEVLEFVLEEGIKEAYDNIILKNTLPYSIAYKVKTTSPEKYRVRPCSGYVKPGSDVEVLIHLQNGYQNTLHKDKFLIMAMEVTNESNTSFADLWKNAQKESIMEHRLRCVVSNSKGSRDVDTGQTGPGKKPNLAELSKKVDTLYEMNRSMKRSVNLLLFFHFFFLSLLLGCLCYGLYTYMYEDASFIFPSMNRDCNKYTQHAAADK